MALAEALDCLPFFISEAKLLHRVTVRIRWRMGKASELWNLESVLKQDVGKEGSARCY